MPAMKLTPNAAMRARDVSRPRAEHLAEAEAAEARYAGRPPASSPADLALDVTQLGAAYLGGTRLGALAGSGLVAELRPGATRQLSAALAWDPAPWCPMVF